MTATARPPVPGELADMVRIDDRLVPLSIPVAGGMLAAIKH